MHSIEQIQTLNIWIPPVPAGTHHPISRGQKPKFYRLQDLKDQGQARTDWLTIFERHLVGLFWRLGGPVPYAFRTADDTIRSLDAGCLKFLWNRVPAEVTFACDSDKFINTVAPGAIMFNRYAAEKDKLTAQYAQLSAA